MTLGNLLRTWQKKSKIGFPENRTERRSGVRLVYSPANRPILKVSGRELEVLDISEKGLKVLNYKRLKFGEQVSGTVVFSSGKEIEVMGNIKWHIEGQFGIFAAKIPQTLILEEVQILLKEMS